MLTGLSIVVADDESALPPVDEVVEDPHAEAIRARAPTTPNAPRDVNVTALRLRTVMLGSMTP